jgi:anaerobic selenocysteine-containing dehydrogenase
MRRVGESYVEASWEEAIGDIAARMNRLIEADGPDAVGVYYGNPSGFSSSNIIFMNGWLDAIGTHSRYFVGSVDQNAMHVVSSAMYGSQLMSPVSDIDNCDYFLLVGTNPAVSAWNWLESVPGGSRRALDRQKSGAKIVVVDPVRTESAEKADVHLAVRPGQDWALLLAMVKVILDESLEHAVDCRDLATGVPELRALVAEADLDDLAARCDVEREQFERVARDFAAARGAMVVTRTGVSLHEAGTVAEWLGHVLNVITGRMDRPGGRRFERGYVDALRMFELAKTAPHRSRIKGREMVAGAHGLSELPDEITTPGPGQIRALVINSGSPRSLRARWCETRCGPWPVGPTGRHRLRPAGEPSTCALVATSGALAGAQRPARLHQQHARRAVRAVRREGSRAATGCPGGVAHLGRSRNRHAAAAVRSQGRQRLRQGHPQDGNGHPQTRPRVQPALDRPAARRDVAKDQRPQVEVA